MRGIFGAAYCRSLSYSLRPKKDEFSVDDFLLAVGRDGTKASPTGSVICSPSSRSSDYHLHVSWRVTPKGEFSFTVEFFGKYREQDSNEREPFAEGFFPWMYQFCVTKKPHRAHVHADFEYPSSVHSARVFLLPLKTVIGPKSVAIEIDGMSFLLTPAINGVEKFWLTQGSEELTVHLAAEQVIDFGSFDPARELSMLSEAVDSIIGRKSDDNPM